MYCAGEEVGRKLVGTDAGNHYGFFLGEKTFWNKELARNVSSIVWTHFPEHGYTAYELKNLRGAEAYGFTQDSLCPRGAQGWHYCKFVTANSSLREKMYNKACDS